MEIRDKEKLVKLLEHWRDSVLKTPKSEHYDLSNESRWYEHLKEINNLISELEKTKDEKEIREILKKLFRHRGEKLIFASQARIIPSFIENCAEEHLLMLKDIILDVKRSDEFKRKWIDEFYSELEKWNPDGVQKFRGLKGILSNIFGELFGKLHIQEYPIMNSCSRRFLEKLFEFDKYDYNGFYQAFEKLKEIYLKEVGRLNEYIPTNIEIDMMFNYFDKDEEGKRVFNEILKGALKMSKYEQKSKTEPSQNYWIEIGGPPSKDFIGKFLWAPKAPQWKLFEEIQKDDVVYHYVTLKGPKEYREKFVGKSKVKERAREIGKDELVRVMRNIDESWEEFFEGWENYDTFYLVELYDYREFKKPVSKDEVGFNPPQKYFIRAQPEIVEKIERLTSAQKEPKIDEKTREEIDSLLTSKKQIILYGPPGTGKTWLARKFIESETGDDREYYEFVTFHPSYSYEEFVEGLKPVPAENGVKFFVEDGIFKRMAIKAMCGILKNQKDYSEISKIADNLLEKLKEIERGITENSILEECNKLKKELWTNLISLDEEILKSLFKGSDQAPKFYLIIDEINRGDISKIFGELITLLEADKRLGGENQIIVTLPYSKEPFAVPPNLYIIGTMNTADRSIALIDIALRRRFGFIELMPDYGILERVLLESNILEDEEVKEIRKLAINALKALNERIKREYDRDHQIGHSYLFKLKEAVDKNSTLTTLKFIWYHEILPLLQEYFYDSPDKLEKVLNGRFVEVGDSYFEFKEVEGNDFLAELKGVAESGEQA